VARSWGDVIGLTPDESAEMGALMRDPDLMFALRRTPGDSGVVDRAADRYVEIVTRRVDSALAAGDNQLIEQMAADLDDIDVERKPQSLGSYVAANLFDGFRTSGSRSRTRCTCCSPRAGTRTWCGTLALCRRPSVSRCGSRRRCC